MKRNFLTPFNVDEYTPPGARRIMMKTSSGYEHRGMYSSIGFYYAEMIADPLPDVVSWRFTELDDYNKYINQLEQEKYFDVQPIFKWFDFWVGWFWDKKKRWLYVFYFPMCGIIFKFKK